MHVHALSRMALTRGEPAPAHLTPVSAVVPSRGPGAGRFIGRVSRDPRWDVRRSTRTFPYAFALRDDLIQPMTGAFSYP
jgi:hypothetical protein